MMQSGLGLLRLDTSLGQEQGHMPGHGIPTPISAGCEERKSSMSSWSFLSQPSLQGSQTSSVSSFASCAEPSTPEPQSLSHIDYPSFSSTESFEHVGTSPSTPAPKGNYHESVYLNSSPEAIPSNVSFADVQWNMVPRPLAGPVYGLQSSGVDGMMPACGDFSSSMAASLMTSPVSYPPAQHHTDASLSWSQPTYMSQLMAAAHEETQQLQHHGLSHPSDFSWPLPIRNVLPSNSSASMPTVVPSDAMPPAFDYVSHDTRDYGDIVTKDFALLSPARSDPGSYFGPVDIKTEHEDTLHWVPAGSRASRRGKKIRRFDGQLGSKRGCKRNATTQPVTLRNGIAKGRHIHCPVSETKKKPYYCKAVIKDVPCPGRFERIEHLRRHELIHEGGEIYYCPLAGCRKAADAKDPEGLGRRDNWRDHLKTHLRNPTGAGRNVRCSKAVLWKALRESCQGEEAEKTIGIIEESLKKEEEKKLKERIEGKAYALKMVS